MSEHNRRAWGERQPINRHPLFPAIVALWGGALFGLASMLVSPALIEGVVVSLGIDRVIPMAAPPLGATSRILLALLMTFIGAGAGLLLARRLAASPAEPQERRRRSVPVEQERRKSRIMLAGKDRSGLSARRRPLAAPADDADHDAERAPVPGQDTGILSVTEFALDGFEDDDWLPPAAAADAVPEPDEGARASASFAPRPPAGAQVFLTTPEPAAAGEDEAASSLFESYSREISARAGQPPAREATIVQPPVPGFMLLSSVASPVASPTPAESEDLVEEALAALVDDAGFPARTVDAPAPPEDVPFAPQAADADVFGEPSENLGARAAERIMAAELDDLSPVELLERLALVMARRREQARLAATAPAAPESSAEPVDEPLSPLPAADAEAPVPPAFEPSAVAPLAFEPLPFRAVETPRADAGEPAPAPMPLGLRPVGLRALEDEDDALPAYIPPRHIGLAPAPLTEDDGEDEDSRVLEEGYSSLLDLSRPLPRLAVAEEPAPFARPEAGGDAPFPLGERRFDAASGPDPEATERALREALATLQRMSGAA